MILDILEYAEQQCRVKVLQSLTNFVEWSLLTVGDVYFYLM
jgi:hypothetical protein